jgi:cytochrome c553
MKTRITAVILTASLLTVGAALAQPRGALIASCAACHGEDGIAREADVPHLAGQNEAYMLNQMANFRNGSRRHPEMRFMARELGDRDIKDIIAYYAALPAR